MLIKRSLRAAAVAALLATSAISSTALATTSITNGAAHCMVTARQVKIDGASQIWGSAVVVCDVSAVVRLEMRVVEMDGTTIDPTVEVPMAGWWVTLTPNTPVVITTLKSTCVSTEPGNEEFSTRAKLSMMGLQSATDYTRPANDSYAC